MTTKLLITALYSIAVFAAHSATSQTISLDQIMSDPDWIGRSPEQAYWADDSAAVYFHQKREGSELRDLYRISLDSENPELISPDRLHSADTAASVFSPNTLSSDYRQKVYERESDIYVKNLRSGEIIQLTRTATDETDPLFTADDEKVIFSRDEAIFVRNLATGLEYQAADLKTEEPPSSKGDDDAERDSEDEDKDKDKEDGDDYLEAQQTRLFEIIRLQERREELAEEYENDAQRQDSARLSLPYYLGDDTEILSSSLSPDENWLIAIVRDTSEQEAGRVGSMPNYVTASGYVENKEVRSRVGTTDFASHSMYVFDLKSHRFAILDLSALPSRDADPLSDQLQLEPNDDEEEEESFRDIRLSGIQWNNVGNKVLFQAISRDNKDRWLLTLNTEELELTPTEDESEKNESLMKSVDFEYEALRVVHHHHDPAWINRRFIAARWLPDNTSLYYLSEADGYGHLYLFDGEDSEQLTQGEFEVTAPVLSRDGDQIYFRSNLNHPGIYEVFRLDIDDKSLQQLSDLGGMNGFVLSPDESKLLLTHSDALNPNELYVQATRPNSNASKLTQTISEEFSATEWTVPEFIEVASSYSEDPIHSRVYTPTEPSDELRSAVVFIHGAGYLQNAHQGWSVYFREFMFHSLLVQQGYVVLDMDYRASAGYGRDWRTAIYQQMGTPEIQDLKDGIDWLVDNKQVDRNRICTYGGSYGGFLTLMAMFIDPDMFACGAALRPVTDWAHYNHGYTSNILNIPTLDPSAYAKSSPIEFAEGLEKPLLIAHGMQDNNVFFQDSVRLVQRLIELRKENWELAIYPIEAHGFREPSSWFDEYRRIFNLFKENLDK